MRRRTGLMVLSLFVCLSLPWDVFSGTSGMESLVPRETPDGWVLRAAPHIFSKETLFEHINGQADLFLQYGFEQSIFAIYQGKDSSRERIDLDIYDMGKVVQAFGIFSRFRQEGRSAGIGLDSYLEDRYALFYKGKYFVVLQATESNPSGLKQLAKIIESRIIDGSLQPKEIAYFPENGLKPGSIAYFPQGLLGRQFLKRGFKATYVAPDKTKAKPEAAAENPDSNLFIAIFDNPEEAMSSLQKYREDLSKKGSVQTAISTQPGFRTLKGEDPYHGKVTITRKGAYLVGAVGFEKEKDGENLLAELIESMK